MQTKKVSSMGGTIRQVRCYFDPKSDRGANLIAVLNAQAGEANVEINESRKHLGIYPAIVVTCVID